MRIKELIQSFVVFVYFSARNKNVPVHKFLAPKLCVLKHTQTFQSIMFDVDDCPPLLTLTRVNALLAFRSPDQRPKLLCNLVEKMNFELELDERLK